MFLIPTEIDRGMEPRSKIVLAWFPHGRNAFASAQDLIAYAFDVPSRQRKTRSRIPMDLNTNMDKTIINYFRDDVQDDQDIGGDPDPQDRYAK